MKQKCVSCKYEWESRSRRKPKACPRCKSRMDFPRAKKVNYPTAKEVSV